MKNTRQAGLEISANKDSLRNKIIAGSVLMIVVLGVSITSVTQHALERVLVSHGTDAALTRQILRQFILTGTGMTIAGIAAAVLFSVYFSRVITAPIAKLTHGVLELARGRRDVRLDVSSRDEVGNLAQAFNIMTQELRETTTSVDVLHREVLQRKQAEDRYRRGELFLTNVFTGIQDGIVVMDKEMTVIRANATLEKWFPQSVPLVGKKCHQAFYGRESLCADCYLQDTVKGGKTCTKTIFLPGDNGAPGKWLECSSYPLVFGETGQIEGVVEYMRDVTERKKVEKEKEGFIAELRSQQQVLTRQKEELLKSRQAMQNVAKDLLVSRDALEQQQAALQGINKELDDFTYIVSHDLKEPLRSIDAFSKFLEKDCGEALGAEGTEYLARIRANASRMQRLIDDLLEVSRIDRKKNPFEEVAIADLIAEVRARLEYSIQEKQVTIAAAPELPRVVCDRVRLLEVFHNLVSNAVKYNDKSEPRIDIGWVDRGAVWELYVRDNGPGIEEQYFDKIFQIFQRLGRKTDGEGSGAGLTIVKKIVEMHKGRIWVESRVGEGTTFYFTLPKAPAAPAAENTGVSCPLDNVSG
jgi:signal transduction histidine kinase